MQHNLDPVLAVDPAMLGEVDEDEYEYEYEYDDTETETFYINLDLTSYNGPIRPPRRRQESSTTSTTPARGSSPPADATESSAFLDENNVAIEGPEGSAPQDQVQILDLHSRNPIISYQNQIFSCSWADMIGTELLFTRPELEPEQSDSTYLRSDRDYVLITANSVKVLGRKANLISSSGGGKAIEGADGPVENAEQQGMKTTNQARFLRRLMNAKQAKGETDMVRTVYSIKRGQNFEDRLRGWARTEERMAEIQRLNQGALQGDMNALMALEDIYAQIENANSSVPSEQYPYDGSQS
ncbi:hypothetical protein VTN00DRAFT_4617 [Thermoascus crustaceus]|uniref:uncharacterized protein n=1 Tax=Thermoascus crustaceus TaxID=5088 RepID=UPI00374370BC